MFIRQVVDERPQEEIGQAVAQEVVLKSIPSQPLEPFCLCDLGLAECKYVELAFYGGPDNDKYKNDYTTFFINKVDVTDVVTFSFVDVDTDEETELNNLNAGGYGVYYDEADYTGIRVNYNTFKDNFTERRIYFKVVQNVFGTDLTNETHHFHILPYSDERADNTVRIETINSGRIESGNNYGSIDWNRSTRIRGNFGKETPSLVVDNYQDENRVIRQIQDKIEVEFTLETELVPNSIYKMLMYNDMLANEILISDYNLQNVNYKGVSVTPTEIGTTHYEKNSNSSYEITFREKRDNRIKRNK